MLKDHSNPVWSLGADLIAPLLYQGGALLAQGGLRTAEQKLAVADYARVAQRAFNDGAFSGSLLIIDHPQGE